MQRTIGDDEVYDYLDIDCEDCGLKFFVRPHSLDEILEGRGYPTRCWKCTRSKNRGDLLYLLDQGVCP